MAVDYVAPTPRNGNGRTFPLSRKAFFRIMPSRVHTIEDTLEHLDQRLDAFGSQLAEIAAQIAATVSDPALTARLDNLVEIVGRQAAEVQRINKRTLRSRRKLAVMADQIEASIE